jgi:hypothetical protein
MDGGRAARREQRLPPIAKDESRIDGLLPGLKVEMWAPGLARIDKSVTGFED